MKLILTISLISLLSLSSASFYSVKKVPANIIDTSFLKDTVKAKRPSFAQLTTLLQQTSDVSQITEFLEGMLEKIAANRQDKLAIIEQNRASCSDEETFRNQAISDGQNAAAASQSQLNLCSDQKNLAVRLNELATNALPIYQNQLQELTDQREAAKRDNQNHLDKLAELEANLQKLNELLDAYEAAGNNPSTNSEFIQHTNKLLKNSMKTGHASFVLPIYTKLIQMHSKQQVDEEALTEIRGLINQLTEKSVEARQAVEQLEAAQQASYDDASARLQQIINNLNAQIATTTAFQGTMDTCIGQESSILDLSNDKVDRNTQLLQSSEELCAAAEEEWRLSELSRAKEVNIINALLSAVKRIEQDYETERTLNVENTSSLQLL